MKRKGEVIFLSVILGGLILGGLAVIFSFILRSCR